MVITCGPEIGSYFVHDPEHKNKKSPLGECFVFTVWQGEKMEDTKVSEAGSRKFSAENYP
jgi:hypothetical protein